jgi:hypothetical protein
MVLLTTYLVHRNSPQSRDSSDDMAADIKAIETELDAWPNAAARADGNLVVYGDDGREHVRRGMDTNGEGGPHGDD